MAKTINIIGGGIIGLSTAYYLVKSGFKVNIIDRGDMDSGASYVNAGYLTPSHFVPLAAPGIISKGLKWIFNSTSPFYIEPRLDWDFLRWILAFKNASTVVRVEKAIPELIEINLKSFKLFQQMKETFDFSFHFEEKGLLMVFKDKKTGEVEISMAERALTEGLDVSILTASQLQRLQPVFSDEVLGGVHYRCDAHMTPSVFMRNLKTWLERNGVKFNSKEEVTGFEFHGRKIEKVITNNSVFENEELVLAAGAWSPKLAKILNFHLPIQGGKGYSLDINRSTGITLPTILTDAKVAVTPMKDFTRFAGTMEFSGINERINKKRVGALCSSVAGYYRDFEINSQEKASAKPGLRPVSPDGLPLIGRSSKYDNLSIATGHAMMGWSLGPVTGKLISEVIEGRKTSVNLAPFDPNRKF